MRRVDLHNHSWFSDGLVPPATLVREAREKGLEAIALTDHDSILGLPEAFEAGRKTGVEVLSGIELDAIHGGLEIHILGFGFDPLAPRLVSTLDRFREERIARLRRMVKLFNETSGQPPLDFERDVAPECRGTPMIPHLINVLSGRGLDPVYSRKTWFSKGKPCYVGRDRDFPAAEAIRLLHEAGGVAVLAHPYEYFPDQDGAVLFPFLEKLLAEGLDGAEVFYPYDLNGVIWGKTKIVSWEAEKRGLEAYCRERDLLMTGGGDWHGRGDVLGCVDLDYEVLARVKARCRSK